MNKIIFVYKDIKMGGASLLIHRMSKWYKEHDNNVIVLCSDIQKSMEIEFSRDNIELIKCNNWNKSKLAMEIKRITKEFETVRVFYFTFEEFLWSESRIFYVKTNKNIIKFLYVLHPRILLRIESVKNKYIFKFLWKYYRRLILSYIQNGNIVFMDEETIERTESFYKLDFAEDKLIYRLPMYVKRFNEDLVRKKAMNLNEQFNIITISRADFPFKGYIIGLISSFSMLYNYNSKSSLTIIASGKDEQKIKNHIIKQNENVQRKIKLIGEVEHSKISQYLDKSHVFVGMGTSVLDAVNNSVISIPVLFDTYNAKASSFFHQRPQAMSAKIENAVEVYDLLVEVMHQNQNEYYQICKNSHIKLKEYYEIDNILNELEERYLVSKENIMNVTDKLLEDLMHIFRQVKRRFIFK